MSTKCVFVSNYLNHHQIPFCNAMRELLGGSFLFIQTEPMEEERVKMGWNNNLSLPYLKLFYEEPEECKAYIEEAEVVLFGGCEDESYIAGRLAGGKPVMRISERLYREGQWKAVSPRGLWKKYHDHTRYGKAPVSLLCSGAYVPSDFHIIRAYKGKMYRWGYFTETKKYDMDDLLEKKGYVTTDGRKILYLLWVARMLKLKHPELALETARHLKEKGVVFHMDLIGDGPEAEVAKALAKQYGLMDEVTFLGAKKPDEVRSYMEKADIFLFTSDRREGWGAVVNEAMNSGCAVIGDHMVGAVPYLVKHGQNGFAYRDGDVESLLKQVEILADNKELRDRIGKRAYETIVESWNAENAAARLVKLLLDLNYIEDRIPDGRALTKVFRLPITEVGDYSGPCSPAPVLAEHGAFDRICKAHIE